jgi:hypothetical protein
MHRCVSNNGNWYSALRFPGTIAFKLGVKREINLVLIA